MLQELSGFQCKHHCCRDMSCHVSFLYLLCSTEPSNATCVTTRVVFTLIFKAQRCREQERNTFTLHPAMSTDQPRPKVRPRRRPDPKGDQREREKGKEERNGRDGRQKEEEKEDKKEERKDQKKDQKDGKGKGKGRGKGKRTKGSVEERHRREPPKGEPREPLDAKVKSSVSVVQPSAANRRLWQQMACGREDLSNGKSKGAIRTVWESFVGCSPFQDSRLNQTISLSLSPRKNGYISPNGAKESLTNCEATSECSTVDTTSSSWPVFSPEDEILAERIAAVLMDREVSGESRTASRGSQLRVH